MDRPVICQFYARCVFRWEQDEEGVTCRVSEGDRDKQAEKTETFMRSLLDKQDARYEAAEERHENRHATIVQTQREIIDELKKLNGELRGYK